LLCENSSEQNDACGHCKSCIQTETRNNPDIHYITHEKATISVEDIREQLNSDIGIKPYTGKYKIYIMQDANKMTEQAQNALLKTIEEPPSYAVIILITNNLDALLPTIQSRCIHMEMKPIGKDEIANYLIDHLQMEPEIAKTASGFCQGNVGKAIRFAASEDFQIMKHDVLSLLKSVDSMEVADIIDTVKDFSKKKNMFTDYLDLMMLWYRDVLMFKVTKDNNLLLYQNEYNSISKQASNRSYEDLENIINAIEKAKIRLNANVNFELVVELLVLTIKD
ncbi:MAG: DNA polymerase III subunit delta, partial [Ruminococcus flavefaciens]|nr:DNA polymerase III subunit delta [Ruminococcus flavefaciens]